MNPYMRLFEALLHKGARFVHIGVGGANYYMLSRQDLFLTADRDLLLPLDPANTLTCWQTAEEVGFELWNINEPLGAPLDLWLAERVVERRAVITGIAETDYKVDLTYDMAGFSFEAVWEARRSFNIEDLEIPVAPFEQIIESKRRAARKKDLLFFATHGDVLREQFGIDIDLEEPPED